MDYYRAFPLYMGYQGYGQLAQQGYVSEDKVLEDLEYLQQMYPTYAKKYQRVICDAVDKVDYEGSFIYDQYPDKITLQRMVASVLIVIKKNEEKEEESDNFTMENDVLDRNKTNSDMSSNTMMTAERAPWSEKEPWIRELVTVLMYYEILGRRRKKVKHWNNFPMQ